MQLPFSEANLGGLSQVTAQSAMKIVAKWKEFLSRWTNSCESHCPNHAYDMKFSNALEAACTTDSCDQSYKSCRLMINGINKKCSSHFSSGEEGMFFFKLTCSY